MSKVNKSSKTVKLENSFDVKNLNGFRTVFGNTIYDVSSISSVIDECYKFGRELKIERPKLLDYEFEIYVQDAVSILPVRTTIVNQINFHYTLNHCRKYISVDVTLDNYGVKDTEALIALNNPVRNPKSIDIVYLPDYSIKIEKLSKFLKSTLLKEAYSFVLSEAAEIYNADLVEKLTFENLIIKEIDCKNIIKEFCFIIKIVNCELEVELSCDSGDNRPFYEGLIRWYDGYDKDSKSTEPRDAAQATILKHSLEICRKQYDKPL